MIFNLTFPVAAEDRVVAPVGAMSTAPTMNKLMRVINRSRRRKGSMVMSPSVSHSPLDSAEYQCPRRHR
jgi:hypothetical protein